jgi:hypothetical protein
MGRTAAVLLAPAHVQQQSCVDLSSHASHQAAPGLLSQNCFLYSPRIFSMFKSPVAVLVFCHCCSYSALKPVLSTRHRHAFTPSHPPAVHPAAARQVHRGALQHA